MGAMLLFILGIVGVAWFSLHQFSEQYRFDMVSDAKNGGVFVIDKKTAAINYCDNKTCSLVGNGALPSQVMDNPIALASLQNAIMGSPAKAVEQKTGQVPEGMEENIASSDNKEKHEEEITKNIDSDNEDDDEDNEDDDEETTEGEDEKTPEGFDF